MDESANAPPVGPTTGERLMRQFLPTSPFVGHLGMRLEAVGPDTATLLLPFAEPIVTIGATIHGGAIATLIDTAAMVAAWSSDNVPDTLRGSTVGMTVAYLAPATGQDARARATVLRRGRSLVYLDVEVRDTAGSLVAKGLVTYKLG